MNNEAFEIRFLIATWKTARKAMKPWLGLRHTYRNLINALITKESLPYLRSFDCWMTIWSLLKVWRLLRIGSRFVDLNCYSWFKMTKWCFNLSNLDWMHLQESIHFSIKRLNRSLNKNMHFWERQLLLPWNNISRWLP